MLTHIRSPEQVPQRRRDETRIHEADPGGTRRPAEVAPAVFVEVCVGLEFLVATHPVGEGGGGEGKGGRREGSFERRLGWMLYADCWRDIWRGRGTVIFLEGGIEAESWRLVSFVEEKEVERMYRMGPP
jgi:hypothetical protein